MSERYLCAKCGKDVPQSHTHISALPHEAKSRDLSHQLFARRWPETIEPKGDAPPTQGKVKG